MTDPFNLRADQLLSYDEMVQLRKTLLPRMAASELERFAKLERMALAVLEGPTDYESLIGEVGLRLLRYERDGGTLTVERVTTTMLNVFDEALAQIGEGT